MPSTQLLSVRSRTASGRAGTRSLPLSEVSGRTENNRTHPNRCTRPENKKKTACAETILEVQIMFDNKPKTGMQLDTCGVRLKGRNLRFVLLFVT